MKMVDWHLTTTHIYTMEPELIAAITRLSEAHVRLADNVGRIADALHHTDGKVQDFTLADAIIWQMSQIGSAIEAVAAKLPEAIEDEKA